MMMMMKMQMVAGTFEAKLKFICQFSSGFTKSGRNSSWLKLLLPFYSTSYFILFLYFIISF